MTNNEFSRRTVRHGELLLLAIDELPENLEQVFEGKEYIVGHSETGHHHVAVATELNGLTIFKPMGADSQDIYLRVSSPSKIEHKKEFDKHQTLDLYEGLYLVRPKTEYDPWAKLLKRVQD